MVQTHVALATALVGLLAASACSSDSEESSPEANGGSGATFAAGGTLALGGTSSGGSAPVGGKIFDGGSAKLTQEQAEAIVGEACAGWQREAEAVPSVMQMVVDVSSSMRRRAPGTDDSKWEVTRDALLEAVVGVDGVGLPGSIAVGMLFYPNREDVEPTVQPQGVDACVNVDAMVPMDRLGDRAAAHRSLIRSAIENVRTERSTPTHDAFQYALQNGLQPTELDGRKFMLLITDGQPTVALSCSNPEGLITEVDADPIVDEIQQAAEQGIRTFLIGSPGSEDNRDWMSYAAVLGGTAPPGCNVEGPDYCHMDLTEQPDFTEALRAGLAKIAGVIAPCTYGFAEPPPGEQIDANAINVILGGQGESTLIIRDDVGDCDEGWQLTDDQQVLLCSKTCQDVQSDPDLTVEVAFGCASVADPNIK